MAIELASYLGRSAPVPWPEVGGPVADPAGLVGFVSLVVDGVALLDWSLVDDLVLLWAAVAGVVPALRAGERAEAVFADQGVTLRFEPDGDHVLMGLAGGRRARVARARRAEVVQALVGGAQAFFDHLAQVAPALAPVARHYRARLGSS